MKPTPNKPPYKVPTMADVLAVAPNGYKVASTFCGCGGSSLGYRMAGFRVVWANEFIAAARDSYIANKAPGTVVDSRDIRKVTAAEIFAATGLQSGELDLFDGSPPCASFSTAGKREAGWGKVRKYSDSHQRTDDLFHEYIRLLKELRPKVFVAENVSGLIKGVAKGYFLEILAAMKAAGYEVQCAVVDTQWLGVPQARQRTIFVGVRNDLVEKYDVHPAFPTPLQYRYSVRDAIPNILGVEQAHGFKQHAFNSSDKPMPTILADRPVNVEATQPLTDEPPPESSIAKYCTGAEWDKLKPGEASEKYFSLVKVDSEKPCPTVCASHGSPGIASITHPTEKRKFSIPELKRIGSFPDDFILTGTYAQQWERIGRAVPPLAMKAIAEAVAARILDTIRDAEAAEQPQP